MPVVGIDHALARVPQQRLQAHGLREHFAQAPAWEPEVRSEPRFTDRTPADAAVLVALIQRPQGLQVLLTERTAHLPTHAGQIAFAGGKVDLQDHDAQAAALREAHEEIGLSPTHVDVIGHLPIYTTGTAFHVTPVVALVRDGFTLSPNPGEVASVFEVPLAFLMNPAHHRRHAFEWQGRQRHWFSMPYTEAFADGSTQERFIWGATAGMLRNLYRFLVAEATVMETS